ncbi:hypothetical protein Patl1_10978 [Pistacia atlantica]|uniref:Uncharacterized protein n=1 Tax=Pistacia atlantica TaxID=434234 RepID=A0ACC1A2Z9_9ROSI|nr:hypothetical protein Patl1_10978 [Pistacia atlantica]
MNNVFNRSMCIIFINTTLISVNQRSLVCSKNAFTLSQHNLPFFPYTIDTYLNYLP